MTPVPLDSAVRAASRVTALPVPRVRAAAPVPLPRVPAGPLPEVLTDRYGRTVRDLRLSLTDRCNLRCTYCMPAKGMSEASSTTSNIDSVALMSAVGRMRW